MKYAIVLKAEGKPAMLTNITFKTKKDAMGWKHEHNQLKTNVQCSIKKL